MSDLESVSQWLAANPNGTEAQANALVAAGQLAADPEAVAPEAAPVAPADASPASQDIEDTPSAGAPSNPNIPAGLMYSDAVLGWVPIN